MFKILDCKPFITKLHNCLTLLPMRGILPILQVIQTQTNQYRSWLLNLLPPFIKGNHPQHARQTHQLGVHRHDRRQDAPGQKEADRVTRRQTDKAGRPGRGQPASFFCVRQAEEEISAKICLTFWPKRGIVDKSQGAGPHSKVRPPCPP